MVNQMSISTPREQDQRIKKANVTSISTQRKVYQEDPDDDFK